MGAKAKSPARGDVRGGHRKWPAEVRLQVAQAVVDRATPARTVAQAFGIPWTTVMDWVHRYKRYGADPKAWWSEDEPAETGKRGAARNRPPAGGGGGVATSAPRAWHAANPGPDGALRGPGGVGDDGAADPPRRGAARESTRGHG
jgi:hypothetical protein